MYLYGFSPVCIFIWFLRVLFSTKSLLQCLHWYGFSRVCSHIFCKMTSICKSIFTFTALMLFLPSVHIFMCIIRSLLCGNAVTLAALMCFFSSVYLHMFYKMASLFKSSVTLTALMWFFPSVCSQMFCKIIYICKCLVTLATLKWVLPSVHSLVLYKIKLFQINTCCHDHMKMVGKDRYKQLPTKKEQPVIVLSKIYKKFFIKKC